jgi:hypothetical protein
VFFILFLSFTNPGDGWDAFASACAGFLRKVINPKEKDSQIQIF